MALIFSLWASASFWEGVEYVAEALVLAGAAFEVLTDFEYILKGDANRPVRHRLARIAAITLVVGLAIELGALVRTNSLFTDEIADSYHAAKDANNRSTL